MRRCFLLCALWLAAPAGALAGDEDASAATAEPDATATAEYVRLGHEMKRLAEKDHWDGVEHVYGQSVATGHPLSFTEHMWGASAALARGDIGTARERLLAARELRNDDPEVIETLWGIDTAFARVVLQAEVGAELQVEALPFDPKLAKAVGFARHRLAETGDFEGYLPAGNYTVGDVPFRVEVREIGAEPIVVDARSDRSRKKRHR